MLAPAKPVKPSPFVRPKDSRFPTQRQACFAQNTTLKFVRKSRQFMKVHIGSDEKFSSGFFARFEFLHTLQVIFQFINTLLLSSGSASFSAASFYFSAFFQGCPLPASSDERSF